jgi:hypothetical protein
VKTDNIGAMFMAQNVDTPYRFVKENLEEGMIKIEFVTSVEDESDIFFQECHSRNLRKTHTSKRGTMTERFCIGRVLEISLTFKAFRFSL